MRVTNINLKIRLKNRLKGIKVPFILRVWLAEINEAVQYLLGYYTTQ